MPSITGPNFFGKNPYQTLPIQVFFQLSGTNTAFVEAHPPGINPLFPSD